MGKGNAVGETPRVSRRMYFRFFSMEGPLTGVPSMRRIILSALVLAISIDAASAQTPSAPTPATTSKPATQAQLDEVKQALVELTGVVKNGFAGVNGRLDKLETTVAAAIVRIGNLETRVDGLEGTMNRRFAELLCEQKKLAEKVEECKTPPPVKVVHHHHYRDRYYHCNGCYYGYNNCGCRCQWAQVWCPYRCVYYYTWRTC